MRCVFGGRSRYGRIVGHLALTPMLALSLVAAVGCGADSDRRYEAEEVARCITVRSGTLLSDPLRGRPVNFRLSPALRRRAKSEPTVGSGSILPRPTSFAAFPGSDVTFVPRGFDDEGFVPAAFVFFNGSEAAQAHRGDADARYGNALIVFHGDAPQAQREFVAGCF